MVFIIIGVVLIGLGAFLFYNRKASLNKAMEIKYHETSKTADVIDTYKQVKGELSGSVYNGGMVELKGIGNASQPLIGEYSQRPALFMEISVERRYEYTEEQRDNDGNYRTVTRTGTETVSSRSEHVLFYLDDGSGAKILVDMEGAQKDSIKSYEEFRSDAPLGFNFSFSSSSRTLGYTYREKIIPDGARLYVLGEVSDRRGEICIVKPSEKGNPFIISVKSEEEIIKSAESSALWQMVGAIASAVIGLGLIIAGIAS